MNQDNMNEINQNEDDKNAANMNQDDQDQDEFLDRKEQILNHNSAKNFKEFNIENELKKLPAK